MTRLRRILRHLLTPVDVIGRAFPRPTREAVIAAVADVEKSHDVMLRVVVEPHLPLGALLRGESARQRAVKLFSQLGVWDTEHNCGVLIYVQLADQGIEIVADRGISAKVKQEEWNTICRRIAREFDNGRFEEGAMLGVREISTLLKTHIPPRPLS